MEEAQVQKNGLKLGMSSCFGVARSFIFNSDAITMKTSRATSLMYMQHFADGRQMMVLSDPSQMCPESDLYGRELTQPYCSRLFEFPTEETTSRH